MTTRSLAGRTWLEVRAAILSPLVFATITLVVTVLHRDRFHFGADSENAMFAAWGWLVVYIVVPIVGWTLVALQWRVACTDRPRQHALPRSMEMTITAHGVVLAVLGVALLIVPLEVATYWPWALSELTGRAVGAWLVGISVAVLASASHDRKVLVPGLGSGLAFGVLQIIALARFSTDRVPETGQWVVDWSEPSAAVYLLFLVSFVVTSCLALFQSRAKTSIHQPAVDSI